MDKETLIEELNDVLIDNKYTWCLYFFKIDRRNNNPFKAYKVRFKNDSYIRDYALSLTETIINFKLKKIDSIVDYTGENTIISCSKIATSDELIKKQWDLFVSDIAVASDEEIKGKYQGYALVGSETNNGSKSIVYLKMSNPVISLQNKRKVIFAFDSNSELVDISDEVCKLYMDTDCIVIDDMIYSFNYKFENLLNIEKTMYKIKAKAIEKISSVDIFKNKEKFEQLAKSHKSSRTFFTLKQERLERVKNRIEREKIAQMLGIEICNEGKLVINEQKEASLLIKYLCFKIFKDDETKELLEGNNITSILL